LPGLWQLHLVYSNQSTQEWVQKGCRTAGIGCLECKQPFDRSMLAEQEPWRQRAQPYLGRSVPAALDRGRRL